MRMDYRWIIYSLIKNKSVISTYEICKRNGDIISEKKRINELYGQHIELFIIIMR